METKNYRVLMLVDNFETDTAELDFGDFSIKTIRPGTKAAEWRRKMNFKRVPEHILMKQFPGYIAQEDDLSGFVCGQL